MQIMLLNVLLLLHMGVVPNDTIVVENAQNYLMNPMVGQLYYDWDAIAEEIIQTQEKPQDVEEDPQYRVVDLPRNKNNEFKSYMDYRAITDKSSKQWKLQKEAYTGEHGIRMIDEYYCVAMGSAFSDTIGAKFEITLKDGQKFKVILADQKSDKHTDDTNRYMELPNGKINIIEFVVDTGKMEKLPRIMGDVSHTSNGLFDGEIIEIKEILSEKTDSTN